ncbi:DEAD/DEAH box helicase family protein, partial [Jutongia sp.]
YQKIVLKIGRPRLIDLHAKKKKYVFFIGPTGVGKTTTIAKIASMLKLSGKVKVALVTSDTYRIAAVEQLKTYANILGVPLKVVYSADEMENAMEELEEYDLVLIDTAGRSHNNKEQKEDIHRLLETVPEEQREVFLVMSATTKYRDLVKISQSYSEITKYSLIFTKLDETDAIGNVFNIRMLTGAPLSYMTWGQNVPDDIGKVDAQKMAKQLLGGNN